MRYQEFKTTLNEVSKMTSKTILTGGKGKYKDVIANGIKNNIEFNFFIDKKEISGIIQNKDIAKLIYTSEDPGKLPITVLTANDEKIETILSSMVKDEVSKGELQLNMGNIAEAVLGSAMTALFAKDGSTVTVDNVVEVGKSIAESNTYTTVTPSKDKLEFNITIPKADQKAFNAYVTGGRQALKDLEIKDEKIDTLEQHFRDAVEFVNTSPRAQAAVEKAKADPRENKVEVLSDGGNAEKQKTTKVDLEIFYDGSKVNLISLKAGSVKQFGQDSGPEFEKLNSFFSSMVGFDISEKTSQLFRQKGEENYALYNYENAFPKAYEEIYKQLKGHISGDNVREEYDIVKQVYNGIRYHATKDEQGVVLVVLSPSKKKAFQELGFGQELMDALENYDLDVNLKSTSNPTIEIYGIAKTEEARELNSKSMLVQMRSYKQSGAIRNVIEMGPLLKDLADLEKLDKQTAEKPKPKATTTPQSLDTDSDKDGAPNWADKDSNDPNATL